MIPQKKAAPQDSFLFSYCRLMPYDVVPEGEQSVEHQLEVLHTEGDSDDRAAEDNAQCEVCQRNLDTAEDDPQHIHHYRQAAASILLRQHLASERPQRKCSQTHNLHTERYAYNREAEHQSAEEVAQREEQTAEDNPNDISDKFHNCNVLGVR